MSLDHIPGLESGMLPPKPPRFPKRWSCLAIVVAAILAWGLTIAAGFLIGRHLDDILGWVAHVAPLMKGHSP